ncbi:DUF2510 domain-containing protein [Cellulosimicrobium sp. NPDC057127]|uniref:DUF2510 domain-containing protein n=1 Tax=Cellulosimicrobium sp. NPDC057127 TaxID=3346026 RepID=UPI00362E1108
MNPQPGWYSSPNEPGLFRWWDGVRWTHTTAPQYAPGYAPAPTSTAPAPAVTPQYAPGYAQAPVGAIPAAAATVRPVGVAPQREWVWGFIYRRPLKTDFLVWWTGVIVMLTILAYAIRSFGLAAFLVDVVIALPLNVGLLVLPLSLLRYGLVTAGVRRSRHPAAPRAQALTAQPRTATVRVGSTEVVFRRSAGGKVTAAARQGTLDAQTLERAKARLRATQKAAGERPWVTG